MPETRTMDESRRRAWEALELGPVWRMRAPRSDDSQAVMQPSASQAPRNAVALLPWSALQQAVSGCTACGLASGRRQTVFGAGPQPASWMIVCEAPGQQEDERGEPFVGPAGQLLDQMLAAIGVNRASEVFITNVLKCRPPSNRDPQPDEVRCCEPYLRRQVALVQPRLILVLGRFAAHTLLGTEASISSLRGTVHEYANGEARIPLVVTYHPAYLLRSLTEKAQAWSDLRLARRSFDAQAAQASRD